MDRSHECRSHPVNSLVSLQNKGVIVDNTGNDKGVSEDLFSKIFRKNATRPDSTGLLKRGWTLVLHILTP
jgi:hypothetical protein